MFRGILAVSPCGDVRIFGSERFKPFNAVQIFVGGHFKKQVLRLTHYHRYMGIANILERFRLDEVQHRDKARRRSAEPGNFFLKIWCKLVTSGSSVAVTIARAPRLVR